MKRERHLFALRQYLRNMYEIQDVKRTSGAGAYLYIYTNNPKN